MQKTEPTPLQHLRRARTMNQQQLASMVGISQQHLSKIERGLLPAAKALKVRLAAVLGVAEGDLDASRDVA